MMPNDYKRVKKISKDYGCSFANPRLLSAWLNSLATFTGTGGLFDPTGFHPCATAAINLACFFDTLGISSSVALQY